MMSGKRGRKCSIKTCDSYQHTHKHLSFFRFPKEPERCRIWIEKSERYDLLGKANVHEERICQLHFEPTLFINESQNRLHQSAIPTLNLTNKCDSTTDDMMFNGIPISLFTDYKLLNMSKSELLYHVQMAAANNLSITAVPNPNSMLSDIKSDSFVEPLNLSRSSFNSTQLNNSLTMNKSDRLNESKSESILLDSLPKTSNGLMKPPQIPNGTTSGGSRRPRQVFTHEQEEQLAVCVRETSNYYSGLSSKEVRIMAYVYGVCNQVEMPPGWHEVHEASFDWCVGFIKRTKLPPTMITGISAKGKQRSAPPSVPIAATLPGLNTSQMTAAQNGAKATAIEID